MVDSLRVVFEGWKLQPMQKLELDYRKADPFEMSLWEMSRQQPLNEKMQHCTVVKQISFRIRSSGNTQIQAEKPVVASAPIIFLPAVASVPATAALRDYAFNAAAEHDNMVSAFQNSQVSTNLSNLEPREADNQVAIHSKEKKTVKLVLLKDLNSMQEESKLVAASRKKKITEAKILGVKTNKEAKTVDIKASTTSTDAKLSSSKKHKKNESDQVGDGMIAKKRRISMPKADEAMNTEGGDVVMHPKKTTKKKKGITDESNAIDVTSVSAPKKRKRKNAEAVTTNDIDSIETVKRDPQMSTTKSKPSNVDPANFESKLASPFASQAVPAHQNISALDKIRMEYEQEKEILEFKKGLRKQELTLLGAAPSALDSIDIQYEKMFDDLNDKREQQVKDALSSMETVRKR